MVSEKSTYEKEQALSERGRTPTSTLQLPDSISRYEKENREADAKLADARRRAKKKTTRRREDFTRNAAHGAVVCHSFLTQSGIAERLKDSYSETGRPSIDPELLLRTLLIGYLYRGIGTGSGLAVKLCNRATLSTCRTTLRPSNQLVPGRRPPMRRSKRPWHVCFCAAVLP
jgi:hypothetical protein